MYHLFHIPCQIYHPPDPYYLPSLSLSLNSFRNLIQHILLLIFRTQMTLILRMTVIFLKMASMMMLMTSSQWKRVVLRMRHLHLLLADVHLLLLLCEPSRRQWNLFECGFNPYIPSAHWYRDAYDKLIALHEQEFDQYTALLPSRGIVIDHSFKVSLLVNLVYNNSVTKVFPDRKANSKGRRSTRI